MPAVYALSRSPRTSAAPSRRNRLKICQFHSHPVSEDFGRRKLLPFSCQGQPGQEAADPSASTPTASSLPSCPADQSYGAEVLLDGASITRSENGSSFDETSPTIEALQEFKVTTSTPSAELGRTTAGIESFVTKSGSNNYHGTAFAIIKNGAFDGNGWFANGYKTFLCAAGDTACVKTWNRPEDSKFDYGGTFSGPVRIPKLYNGRDRTFFLFAWENYKLHLGATTQATVPTATGGTTGLGERGGDFSAILGGPTSVINPCTGQQVLQNQIFDPATTSSAVSATNPNGIPCRLPFAGNIIPPDQIQRGRFEIASRDCRLQTRQQRQTLPMVSTTTIRRTR